MDDWTTVTQEQFNDQLANATAYFLLSRLFREHIVNRSAEEYRQYWINVWYRSVLPRCLSGRLQLQPCFITH